MPKKDGTPTAAEQKLADTTAEEFPSLAGEPGVEIAKRSQDEPDTTAEVHRKVFVVLSADYESATGGETFSREAFHRANIEATRQAMIGQGLRPTGDGSFVGATDHGDGASTDLTYEVPCTPAAIAVDPLVAHARVPLDVQHDAEADAS